MKKNLIFSIVILSTVIGVVMVWQLSEPKPETGLKTTGLPMKIPHSLLPGQYWLSIADHKGWFKEAELNVELINTNENYFASIQDMVDGKLDYNNFTPFDLITFNFKGADLGRLKTCSTTQFS